MDVFNLNMSGLRIWAFENWIFSPFEGGIMARPESGCGLLRLRNSGGEDAAAEPAVLLSAALASAGLGRGARLFDLRRPVNDAVQFGGASLGRGRGRKRLYMRIWYLCRDEGLVFGVYGCPWLKRNEDAAQMEIHQAERMVLSVRVAPAKGGG